MNQAPLIIIGAGIAGMCTALAAAPRPVLLISRGLTQRDCATALAQGGIAAALAHGDSPRQHAEDTLRAGAACNDRQAVTVLTESAHAAIDWLMRLGLEFDRNLHGLDLAREGGHRCARVLHAGGDASGRHLVDALSAAVQSQQRIQWLRGHDCIAWRLRAGRPTAIRLRSEHGETEHDCGDLVLASGSPVGSFADSTHSADSDGAQLALAMRCGARARDLHYLQFHPTALARRTPDGRLPLITEALRGAGAQLRDQAGRHLMAGLHPLADLAPRDIVARCVQLQIDCGRQVWLHAEHLGLDWQRQFPAVWSACQAHDIDPSRTPIPIRTAVHYHMGGLATDLDGRTSLPGLYAVGEVACTGVHGANRLASNSLLEAAVFGRRLGRMLGRMSAGAASLERRLDGWQSIGEPLPMEMDLQLRQLSQALGPLRSRDRLLIALSDLAGLNARQAHWRIDLLSAMLRSALNDPVSRGAHFWETSEVKRLRLPCAHG